MKSKPSSTDSGAWTVELDSSGPSTTLPDTRSKSPAIIQEQIVFQYLSDLHIEHDIQYDYTLPATAPYLILAGDICQLIDFGYTLILMRLIRLYKHIYIVLGNQEFLGRTYEVGLSKAEELQQDPLFVDKVTFLHRQRCDIEGTDITLLGCTLWSHIPSDKAEVVKSKVRDFRVMKQWTVEKHNAAHEADIGWLKKELREIQQAPTKRRVIIVTHHAPSVQETSRPWQVDSPWTCAYATDVLAQGDWSCVEYWIYGHTHHNAEFVKNGVKVVSNQRGRRKKDEETKAGELGYDPGKVLKLQDRQVIKRR